MSGEPASKTIPSWYLVATKYKSIPPATPARREASARETHAPTAPCSVGGRGTTIMDLRVLCSTCHQPRAGHTEITGISGHWVDRPGQRQRTAEPSLGSRAISVELTDMRYRTKHGLGVALLSKTPA